MSKLLRHVALVIDDNIQGKLTARDITKVAAALQKQAARDFGPVWEVNATVSAFVNLDDVPLGYWPIIVGKEGQGGGGVHLDKKKQPYALVDFTPDWTVTASHECLEMLADPFGNRVVAGDSPNPKRPGRVEFLVEVCDPCEATTLGYTVNGVRVSDFYTPRYFEPPQKTSGSVQYDFMGHITESRQVLRDGYLSWSEASGEWFQELFFGPKPTFKSLGKFDNSFASLRAWVDSTSRAMRLEALSKPARYGRQVLVQLPQEHDDGEALATEATKTRADLLREEIAATRAGSPNGGSNGTDGARTRSKRAVGKR